MSEAKTVGLLLKQLEDMLRRAELWDKHQPSTTALASQQPFALDTLEPQQWLQWIFIPLMKMKIETNQIPRNCVISPYFEQVWQNDDSKNRLIALLQQIDKACQLC